MTAISTQIHQNLKPELLIEQAVKLGLASHCETGAPVVRTGKFTGRSPKDKFFVKEGAEHVDWNDFNLPIDEKHFLQLRTDLISYLNTKPEIWSKEVYVGADPEYRIGLTCYTEWPDSSLFVDNMFIEKDENFTSEWTIYQAPGFHANPDIHGTRQGNFAIISLKHKTILIGGTGYTGEIKKGMFTVMNYLLPSERNVLTMHCSANIGKEGDVALFFGLSGTGKTTLSADPNRRLIGDDEHAWTPNGVFNLEGGCYAKVIDLSPENEPQIFQAIRGQALLENVVFHKDSNCIDFSNKSITENTRVSYPLTYIKHAVIPSMGGTPKNIFFLTCDAFGVLPPISKLDADQAMYFFLNGYTAKIAGTEEGIKEPKPTFSTCFGAPFLPLKPSTYAEMLKEKIAESGSQVWMVNTGWTGGGYGVGSRIKLSYTRAMISAALKGELKGVITQKHPIFGVEMPLCCPGVPSLLLNPANTWENKEQYFEESKKLSTLFEKNHQKFTVETV
ncbi:phosphoenolpyruvate carboxykinase (ATP) [Leadbetterella byssophila DSM 17132]|uniref:Phosphoenolpyruvate carboxykinase (ATP) n=1 Tax=Leadbetterella byssophila (strain DSM 17132 / JCM 16389 / KACC 11308 / NBRC 106382 / 4M15) TaxID=649349 RepID=E4RWR0_LEAB4|nr:phosphoenolpyruvate carboxykinase (ATP) [Leadbetterella byssophila]ADQ16229.1 phosphoenolpyruvate carboxykinase (ATP) [Leadbetterella byssophila DSM 17132]